MSEKEIKKLIDNLESKITQVQGTLHKHGNRLDDVEGRVEEIDGDKEWTLDFEEGMDEQK